MLDRDLAKIYGVPTFRFNEAIKRNRYRFPPDFMFQLRREEFDFLKSEIAMSKPKNSSQIAMSSAKHRGTAYRPYAFTEHGALQAAQCSAEQTRRGNERVRYSRIRQDARGVAWHSRTRAETCYP